VVDQAVTVDGQPATVAWDEPSRAWTVDIAGPRTTAPQITASATARGWHTDEPLATFDEPIELLAEPPLPTVAWSGSSTLEGATTANGSLVVTPAAATGGQLCVTFPAPASLSPESLGFEVAGGPHCAADSQPFSVDASLVATQSVNTTGTVDLPFTATYTAAGNSATIDLGQGTAVFAPISLTKPADAGRTAAVTVVLVALSLLLTLGALLLVTNVQRRMREPSDLQRAEVPIRRDGTALERTSNASLRAEDLDPLTGSRRSMDLSDGLGLAAPLTANPFGDIIVRARSRQGQVTADLAHTAAAGRSVVVPARFDELVLVEVLPDDTGRAVALVGRGTSPARVDAMIDQALGKVGDRFGTDQPSDRPAPVSEDHGGDAAADGAAIDDATSATPTPGRPAAAAHTAPAARPSRPGRPQRQGASAPTTSSPGGSAPAPPASGARPRPPRPRP
jgi:hypothetical protein